jgi:hypothetical protein
LEVAANTRKLGLWLRALTLDGAAVSDIRVCPSSANPAPFAPSIARGGKQNMQAVQQGGVREAAMLRWRALRQEALG